MSDIEDTIASLRPLARPEGLALDPIRPQARPESLALSSEPEVLAQAQPDVAAPLRPEQRPAGLGSTIPSDTLAKATQPGVLPIGDTTLIGLINGPDGGAALVRLPGGAVVRVAAGTQVAGGRVTAIDENGLHLSRGSETLHLTMPG